MEEKKKSKEQESELQKHARLNQSREEKLKEIRLNNDKKMYLISSIIAWLAGVLEILSSYVNDTGKTDFIIGIVFICLGFVFIFVRSRVGKSKKK